MNTKKSIFLLFFFLIIFSYQIISVPAPQALGTLQIIYPKTEFFHYGENSSLNFHAVSALNVPLNVTNFNCQAHIYDAKNNHVMVINSLVNDSNWYDKKIILNSSVYNKLGQHSYNLFCNSSIDSGTISDTFYITRNGEEYKPELLAINNIFLILGFGLIGIFCFWISTMFIDKGVEHLKKLFFYLGLVHILIISFVIATTTSCSGGLCGDINRYGVFGETYAYIMVLMLMYVIYSYAIDKVTSITGRK